MCENQVQVNLLRDMNFFGLNLSALSFDRSDADAVAAASTSLLAFPLVHASRQVLKIAKPFDLLNLDLRTEQISLFAIITL